MNYEAILVLGDSNSSLPDPNQCWPAILARKLNGNYHISNESAPGRTIGLWGKELNSCNILKRKIPLYRSLEYIFIMLGTNDVKMCYGPPTLSEIAGNLNAIIDIISEHQNKSQIVFLSPPPIGRKAVDNFFRGDERIQHVCNVIHSLCERRKIALIDTYSMLDADKHLEADAVHLNSFGRALIAEAVCRYLTYRQN